ncbi:MAG TPA: NUDIX hydrolase [Flavisolibacter sp.]|nr:NUDIX hydrolase [Flavisolibacter sp.]
MEWKVLESEYLFKQPWLTVRKEKCELPNGKIMQAYYTLEYDTWVTGFALTKDNKVILIRQYRHGLGVISIETPGGVVDKGESTEAAVARELKEETGYAFESFEYLGKICANPATTNNYMHMYLARGGEKVAEQSLDETEDVEVLLYTIDEVKQLLRENKIVQALHTACMFYALERLGVLSY